MLVFKVLLKLSLDCIERYIRKLFILLYFFDEFRYDNTKNFLMKHVFFKLFFKKSFTTN